MCGIIGYVGRRPCKDLLLSGLERLEYRGYDSAGIALLDGGALEHTRAVGPLPNLKERAGLNGSSAVTGVGHTRWATHGAVTEANAHPLTGCDDAKLSIVLNGIVENFRELRDGLMAEGHAFTSQTDAETVSHLIERHYTGDLVEAVCSAYEEMEGHFTFVAIHADHPGLLVGARLQTPLVVGIGEDEAFLASNAAAFLSETRRVYFPDDGDVVAVTPAGATFIRTDGTPVEHELVELDWDIEGAEKGGFETFMLKEIYEQPEAVAETIGDRVRHGRLELDGLGLTDDELRNLRRIVILATGTAYHAGVTARYALEEWGRIPVEHDIASEWLYRNPVVDENTLVIGISQSGETRDTISAMQLAREKGAHTLAVTNMMGAQITREVDSVLYTRAGLEISVCATKTFTAQVALFYLIALKLAQVRSTLPEAEIQRLLDEVHGLPGKMESFLNADYQPISEIAHHHYDKPFFLYLGRNIGLPICLEGALKLKEISYIPTEAYSAGEMKHGPIALLDENTPVVVVATDSHVYDKIVSNIQECRARGAKVVAIATDGNEDIQHHADDVIFIPRTHPILQAVLAVVPLQLLAYETARLRGLNIDQPRNLAKTVTVE
jgi:glucosamine--fructose-6-phosphate aminotransferase (isomerizing)